MRLARSVVRLFAFVVVLIAVCSCQPAVAAAPASPDARLQGVWQVVTLEKNGEKQPADKVQKVKFLISAEHVAMWVDGRDIAENDYKTDAARKPAGIETKFEGCATLGIYDLDGDQLRLCLTESDTAPPKTFTSQGGATLIVMKRVVFRGAALFVVDADGKNLRQLPQHPVLTGAGSPDWSRDGKRIAWDAWRSVLGENYRQAHILVAKADGSDPKDLGPGAMPSWSTDNKQIAFSNYGDDKGEAYGVWITNADGSDRRMIAPVGWSAKWSPKKNEIIYYAYSQFANAVSSANIFIYDVGAGEPRPLLDRTYSQIWWGMNWSPDGKWICFRGTRPDGVLEIAAVSAEGEKKGFTVVADARTRPEINSTRTCLSWGGDGKQILVSMKGKDDKCRQLYLLDSEGKQPPKAVAAQDAVRTYDDAGWSPDGKKIVFISAALDLAKKQKAEKP